MHLWFCGNIINYISKSVKTTVHVVMRIIFFYAIQIILYFDIKKKKFYYIYIFWLFIEFKYLFMEWPYLLYFTYTYFLETYIMLFAVKENTNLLKFNCKWIERLFLINMNWYLSILFINALPTPLTDKICTVTSLSLLIFELCVLLTWWNSEYLLLSLMHTLCVITVIWSYETYISSKEVIML